MSIFPSLSKYMFSCLYFYINFRKNISFCAFSVFYYFLEISFSHLSRSQKTYNHTVLSISSAFKGEQLILNMKPFLLYFTLPRRRTQCFHREPSDTRYRFCLYSFEPSSVLSFCLYQEGRADQAAALPQIEKCIQ